MACAAARRNGCSIHGFMGSWVHGFMDSLVHGFMDSLVHRFMDSLVHGFVGSWIRWFMDSLVQWFIGSFIDLCESGAPCRARGTTASLAERRSGCSPRPSGRSPLNVHTIALNVHSVALNVHTLTVELTVKSLLSHLITRKFNSPTNSCRCGVKPYLRDEAREALVLAQVRTGGPVNQHPPCAVARHLRRNK
eukprot:237792-Pyramimonas_sp.AAC.1